MITLTEKFRCHIDRLNEIIGLFKTDAKAASDALEDEKLSLDAASREEGLLGAAAYNALATIRTSPEQERPVGQLIEAIAEAAAELTAIMDYVSESEKEV